MRACARAPPSSKHGDECSRPRVELGPRRDLVDQADAPRLAARKSLGGQEHSGAPPARRSRRRDRGRSCAGTRPSRTSADRKHGFGCGDGDVAAAIKPTPPANAAPWTRAMVGFGKSLSCRSIAASPIASATILGVAVARHAAHPVEIGAGGEARARARQHHAPAPMRRAASRSQRRRSAPRSDASSKALCTLGPVERRRSRRRARRFRPGQCLVHGSHPEDAEVGLGGSAR